MTLEEDSLQPPNAATSSSSTERTTSGTHEPRHALEALGVQDLAGPRRTRAVVDGLRLAVCLGRVAPSSAVEALEHHLRMLAHGLGSTG